MQPKKSKMNINCPKLNHRTLPLSHLFLKIINILFPRAHGNQEGLHRAFAPCPLSPRPSKTTEEAAYRYLGNGEHDVSGCHQRVGTSHQLVANHLRKHHADGLAQHDRFCFDSAHSCEEGMMEERFRRASLCPLSIIQPATVLC